LAIVIAGFVVFFLLSPSLFSWTCGSRPPPERAEELYHVSFGVALLLFFFARLYKVGRAAERYLEDWPQSVGRLKTISYGNKRTNLLGLAFVIVLFVLFVVG